MDPRRIISNYRKKGALWFGDKGADAVQIREKENQRIQTVSVFVEEDRGEGRDRRASLPIRSPCCKSQNPEKKPGFLVAKVGEEESVVGLFLATERQNVGSVLILCCRTLGREGFHTHLRWFCRKTTW